MVGGPALKEDVMLLPLKCGGKGSLPCVVPKKLDVEVEGYTVN